MTKVSVATILAGLSGSAFAAGFQIQEQNVTNLGTAYAGTAALAADASTAYYNPAGLPRVGKTQMAISGVAILPHSELTATRATDSAGLDLHQPGYQTTMNPAGVPSLHVSHSFNPCWAVGLSVVSPFGLKTDYDQFGVTRYLATRSELFTIDISPSVAVRFPFKSKGFSLALAAGPDVMHGKAKLATKAGVAGADFGTDSFQLNTAEDWAWSWHLGALLEIGERARIGINYRYKYELHAVGKSESNIGAATNNIHLATLNAKVTLPETLYMSGYFDVTDCWALMADLHWTKWDRLKSLDLRFSDAVPGTFSDVDSPLNFHNTWRVAVGTQVTLPDRWKVKFGYAFDESPVRDADRTLRIPDSDRHWLSVGLSYQFNKDIGIEFGYSHLFFKEAPLNAVSPLLAGTTNPAVLAELDGKINANANIVGVQLNWNFV